jgi:hypothetical protein
MRCTRCGTDNTPGKSICRKCGNFLYANYPNNRVPLTRAQKKAQRRKVLKATTKGCFWLFLAVLGITIVIGLVSFFLVHFILPGNPLPSITTASSTSATSTSATSTTGSPTTGSGSASTT